MRSTAGLAAALMGNAAPYAAAVRERRNRHPPACRRTTLAPLPHGTAAAPAATFETSET